jgi:bacterioferritin
MKDQFNYGQNPKHSYSLPDPYPIPRVMGENHYYASILLEDYAGISGELTAIHQYMYHYLTSESHHANIATLTQQIAIVEMHHLELLGKTIRLLGKYPIMHSNDHGLIRFWNANFVYYGDTVYDKLSANMKHEMDTIRNYRTHQRLIDDPFVQELLERIILDEEHHFQLFKTCRDELCTILYE